MSAGRHAAGLGMVADRDPAAAADAFKRAAAAADSERCVAGRARAAECRVLAERAAWRAGLTVAVSRGQKTESRDPDHVQCPSWA